MTHSDNDGYQSDSEVNGKNGGNGDSGVVVSPKPEMNGTEETKEDNKPKKKKMKKKKKAPDLNESLIERPPAEKKTKPTEVITWNILAEKLLDFLYIINQAGEKKVKKKFHHYLLSEQLSFS